MIKVWVSVGDLSRFFVSNKQYGRRGCYPLSVPRSSVLGFCREKIIVGVLSKQYAVFVVE